MKLEYNGYLIYMKDRAYTIVEEIAPKKYKMRRRCDTHGKSVGNDHFGKLFKAFETNEVALETAKNYIDKHIVVWADSPYNIANQK